MNLQDPINSLMSTDLKTLTKEDRLQDAKDIFDEYNIHHIPVIDGQKLVGIISKTDYLYFLKHYDPESREKYLNKIRLKNYTVAEVMSKSIMTVSSADSIKTALELFAANQFHALPVVDNDQLVGMITTHDVIFRLLHPKRQISTAKS